MKILSRILKHKNPYPAFKTIQKIYNQILQIEYEEQDNPFGINFLNKIRGKIYGIILCTLIVGQKITMKYISYCITQQELMSYIQMGKSKTPKIP